MKQNVKYYTNYTIIIPHYNNPHLLRRCLASIPNREDVQIIVVDDCSSEEVQIDLREMERRFLNVQFVYSDKNLGGGHARNIGLQYAEGKYILFADADDFFHDNLNAFLDDYKEEKCDIVYFNTDAVDSNTLQPYPSRSDRLQSYISSNTDKKANELRFLFPAPWCKMVRKELIDNYQIKFDELFFINDATFSYLTGYYAKDIKVDKRIVYCVTYRPDCLTFTDSLKKELVRVGVMSRKNRFLKDHNISVFDKEMLLPIRKSLKKGEWRCLKAYFSITRKYGYSMLFCLSKIGTEAAKCRIRNFFNSKCILL